VATSAAIAPSPGGDGAPAERTERTVWVINGRPRYHAQDCLIIKGQPAQPVPFSQAVDDGFQPCSLCQRRSFLEGLS
jgi:hypothetical protein